MGTKPSAIVVGAGLSGLTAAHHLMRNGWDVTVLESEATPGGRVRTIRTAGYTFDLGATSVGAGYDAYLQLADELALEMVLSPPCIGMVRGGQIHELRIDRPLRSGLGTRWLSLPAKLRLSRLAFDIAHAKLRGRLDYADLSKAAPIDTETAQAYALRALGPELAQYLCNPLTRTMLIADAEHTSKVELFSGLANALGGDWQAPAGGAASLVEALVSRLDVRLSHPVEQVVEASGAVEVRHRDPDGGTHTAVADACVVACPLPLATPMCPDHRSALETLNLSLPYTRTICITVGTELVPDCPAFMVMLPPSEFREIALFFQDHRKDPARAPAGHGLFTCYFELAAAQMYFEASNESVVEVALDTLCRLWPSLRGAVDFTHVHRWARALPHTRVGTFQRIAEFNASLDPAARIQFAGDYMSETGQNTAVIVGTRAAANLSRHVDRPR